MNIKWLYAPVVMAASVLAQPQAYAGVSCAITTKNVWNNGYQLEITVKNTGSSPINSWSVNLNFPQSPQISEFWNAQLTGSPLVNAKNVGWNGFLVANQTTTFGFKGNHAGNFVVPSCSDGSIPAIARPVIDPTPIDSASGNFGFLWSPITGASKYKIQESKPDAQGNPTTWADSFETESAFAGFGFKAVGRYLYRVTACNSQNQCSEFSQIKPVTVFRFDFGTDSNIVEGRYTVNWTGPPVSA